MTKGAKNMTKDERLPILVAIVKGLGQSHQDNLSPEDTAMVITSEINLAGYSFTTKEHETQEALIAARDAIQNGWTLTRNPDKPGNKALRKINAALKASK